MIEPDDCTHTHALSRFSSSFVTCRTGISKPTLNLLGSWTPSLTTIDTIDDNLIPRPLDCTHGCSNVVDDELHFPLPIQKISGSSFVFVSILNLSIMYYVASYSKPYLFRQSFVKCERVLWNLLSRLLEVSKNISVPALSPERVVYHTSRSSKYPVRESRTDIRRFHSHQIWKMDPRYLTSSNIVGQNLHRVSGVLQDMKDNATRKSLAVPMSPGIPPAAFGAGGKMWVTLFYFLIIFRRLS